MNTWVNAIKQAFNETGDVVKNKSSIEVSISGVDNFTTYEKVSIHSWSDDGANFVAGIGSLPTKGESNIAEALEELLENFLGAEGQDVEFLAARNLITDDMLALEICGALLVDDVPTLFYTIYMTDGKEAFGIVGLSDGTPEHVFDEFSSLARTFNRDDSVTTIHQYKSDGEVYSSLRNIAKHIIKAGDEANVRNATFEVKDGLFTGSISVLTTTQSGTIEEDVAELEFNTDLAMAIEEFLTHSDMRYDIEAFTITCFYDGRYSATFYPLFNEEEHEHEHHHGDDHECCGGHGHHQDDDHECCGGHGDGDGCGCGSKNDDHSNKVYNIMPHDEDEFAPANDELADESDMLEYLPEFAAMVAKSIDTEYQHYMAIVRVVDDKENYTLDVYTADDGNYKLQNLNEKSYDDIGEQLNELGDIVTSISGEWDTFLFIFSKKKGVHEISAEDITYEVKLFDMYYDTSLENTDETIKNLSTYFYEDINNSNKQYTTVTIELAIDSNGVFLVCSPTAYTTDSVEQLEIDSKTESDIIEVAQNSVFTGVDFNCATITVFPDAKVGVTLDIKEENIVITPEIYEEVLEETGLLQYKSQIDSFIYNSVAIEPYEIISDYSLGVVSKVGGNPDIASASDWATTSNGAKMSFLAQINLSEVKPYDTKNFLADKGLLSFFYDENSGECKVLYYKDTDKLERISADDIEDAVEYFPCSMRFQTAYSLPDFAEDDRFAFLGDNEEEIEAYLDISTFVPSLKMFGYPDYISEDIEDAKNLYLLLQVPSLDECGMEWGDSGALYFMIEKEDLDKCDFSKVKCYKQSYDVK